MPLWWGGFVGSSSIVWLAGERAHMDPVGTTHRVPASGAWCAPIWGEHRDIPHRVHDVHWYGGGRILGLNGATMQVLEDSITAILHPPGP